MFNKILIANRGEIACRIIKTARRLKIKTVAVYSAADENSPHVTLADEACYLGEAPATKSYLNIDAIINAAKQTNVDAIHPGYGFLSENPKLANACAKAKLVFIGPSEAALKAMGSKQLAKQLLEKTNVPLIPGYHGNDQDDKTLKVAAKKIGFPLLLKAAAGGGGKGMRIVHHARELDAALLSARHEAKASFGDDTLIIEKYLTNPRHIEVQIIADNTGSTLHLFERDCSIQRRHQKIFEEAPAPNLPDALREQMTTAAIEVARAIHYQNAGTIEFIVERDQFYFMEMNTRLQVEHPVTELITGLDLVELQLIVASNQPLPINQRDIKKTGHAIECRIYAEDPAEDFKPSTGTLHYLHEPKDDAIRIDTGVIQGSEISVYYDPMIAKLIVWGKTREHAAKTLQSALGDYYIGGVTTNIPFLKAIAKHPAFRKAQLSTHFLSDNPITLPPVDQETALLLAAAYDYSKQYPKKAGTLAAETFAWHLNGTSNWPVRYQLNEEIYELLISPINHNQCRVRLNEHTFSLTFEKTNSTLVIEDGKGTKKAPFSVHDNALHLYTDAGPIVIKPYTWQPTAEAGNHNRQLAAPMPATVVAILKKKGDKISAGDPLITLEAMKMEHTITSPKEGVISEVFYTVGAQVSEGAELVALENPSSKGTP